jgi:hypothetical protein
MCRPYYNKYEDLIVLDIKFYCTKYKDLDRNIEIEGILTQD